MERYKSKLIKHSKEFLQLLKEADPNKAIRAITHLNPMLVFWVSPNGTVIDAKKAHHENPPNDDRSILSHKSHKGHLRGRSALIGNVIYIIIYGEGQIELSKKQQALLRRSYPAILRKIKDMNKYIDQETINNAIFINEKGDVINA